MNHCSSNPYTRRRFLMSLGVLAAGVLWSTNVPTSAAHDELPPRPKPIQDDEPNDGQSAWIQLWPTPVLPKLWTVVQWVDGQGAWHDVEGWRGYLNHPTYISWRVLQSEFGKGPFRWVTYDKADGTVLAISETFHLPTNNGEIRKINVPLPNSAPSSLQY